MEKRTFKPNIAIENEYFLKSSGVGGRQKFPKIPQGGGRYLNIYSVSKLQTKEQRRDPRLDSLRAMGLHKTWQNIAEAIGMDNFLTMWRILSETEEFQDKGDNRIHVYLRNYSAYQRFLRDQFVLSLSRSGLTSGEIIKKYKESMQGKIHYSQINNILNNKR